jgi:membrane-associated phospholipid phosphatase
MKIKSSKLTAIAGLISILGHPLLTSAIFAIFILFRLYNTEKALLLSGLVIGGLILPVTIWNYVKVLRGEYSNFDVSERKSRPSMYFLIMILLVILLLILWFNNQTDSLFIGLCFSLVLIVISSLTNLFLKASLHTSLSFFFSFATLVVSGTLGIIMLLLSLLIAMSRLILKRHTPSEVVVGGIIGSLIGGILFYTLRTAY